MSTEAPDLNAGLCQAVCSHKKDKKGNETIESAS